MSIITAAIVPHPPFLIPNIGKENAGLIKKTADSYKEIEADLYAGQIETIIILSSHGPLKEKYFGINIGDEFQINFEKFGDFSSKISLAGDIGLAQELKEKLPNSRKVKLINQPELDHGAGIPLYLLTPNLKNIKIIPVYPSGDSLEAHFEFGKNLRRPLQMQEKRVAVLASGDLSHSLTKSAPAGYSAKATKFDQKILDTIRNKNLQEISDINEETIKEVQTCALKPLSILFGMFDAIDFTPQLLSYEYPFGVGYLALKFNL
ncbi:MAG: AmmeMemoRadiSam system protein B [Patescibacteria group bacterium]